MIVRFALLAVLVLIAAASPAAAAPRSVPYGFFGVVFDQTFGNDASERQEAMWDLMAESGVESVRIDFNWAAAQPREGDPIDFGFTDQIVRRAAERGISLLPIVNEAPTWARAYPGRDKSPPREVGPFAAYVSALVARYGPEGTFWSENPTVPAQPVREWQMWNEPHLELYWDAPERSRWAHPQGYGRLLRAAYRAVKTRDPGAKVVLAGITQRAWDEIEDMYRRGRIKGAFDVAALQIFPLTVKRAAKATRLFHDAMRRFGDRRKKVYITEISWPASKGRAPKFRYLPSETPRGMSSKLAQAYTLLARRRKALSLERVYWYTWASSYRGGGSVFNFSGLTQVRDGDIVPQPALGAYRRLARRLQGCEKDATGTCR